jgi:hypothetical protein
MLEILQDFSTWVAFHKAMRMCRQELQAPDWHTAEIMVINGCAVGGWTGELTPIPPDVRERHKEHIAELNERRRLQGLPPR